MANMSYCRFENTFRDLEDCQEALNDLLDGEIEELSSREEMYKKKLIELCSEIASDHGEDDE